MRSSINDVKSLGILCYHIVTKKCDVWGRRVTKICVTSFTTHKLKHKYDRSGIKGHEKNSLLGRGSVIWRKSHRSPKRAA